MHIDVVEQIEKLPKAFQLEAALQLIRDMTASDPAFFGAYHELYGTTVMESRMLHYLIRRAGSTCSRAQIMSAVWGLHDYSVADHSVSVFITRLRSKIEIPNAIRTVPGVGYRVNRDVAISLTPKFDAIRLQDINVINKPSDSKKGLPTFTMTAELSGYDPMTLWSK